jgi:ankyrin repeat protein
MTTPEDMEEIAAALVNHGATLAAATERNTGPLHCAAIFNNYHALDALLKLNPSISDVRDAMLVCMQRGNSWTSSRMLCSMWRQFPGTLYHPVRQQNDITSKEFPIFESFLNSDNPLSSLCMTWEHGRDDILHGILLSDMIQSLKLSSEGPKALHQLLKQENNQIMMYTPLHYAASSGNVTAVRLLIEEGADVNYSGRPNLDSLVSIGGFDMSSLGLDNDIADIITAASRGMTPLDVALTRNWHMSIYAWPKWDRSIIQMIRNAGGSHAEERRYNKRTGDIIKLLRDEGAKTKAELFSIPEPVVTANKTQKDETLRRFEFRENSTTDSESVSKIMQLFQASIELPSAQITMAKFPNLATNNDPDRPKLSSLFINVDSMFQKFVDTDDWCGRNVQQFEHMRSTYRLFILWATRNEVANGEIDGIQNISPPSQSVQLAASVFICLWDILHTLQMLEELTSREWKPKE